MRGGIPFTPWSRKPVNLLCTRKIVAGNNSRMKRRNLIRINARERLSEHARFLQPFGITKAAGPSKHGNGMYHGERVCGVFDRVPDQSAFRLQGLADFIKKQTCLSAKRAANAS